MKKKTRKKPRNKARKKTIKHVFGYVERQLGVDTYDSGDAGVYFSSSEKAKKAARREGSIGTVRTYKVKVKP
jgi:hypothetical protein